MTGQAAIVEVTCHSAAGGWQCKVAIVDHSSATHHDVTVSFNEIQRYGRSADPTRLVERAFRFLLEREPKESILRQFALSDIERYFPDFA